MAAFGMSATAQTLSEQDSIAKCPQFQARVSTAVKHVSDSIVNAPGAPLQARTYAFNARSEGKNEYYWYRFADFISRNYNVNCTDEQLISYVRSIYISLTVPPEE